MTKGKSMEVNGIAHIFLTASNFERSCEFYRKLLPFLGLKPVIETDTYCAFQLRYESFRIAEIRKARKVPA